MSFSTVEDYRPPRARKERGEDPMAVPANLGMAPLIIKENGTERTMLPVRILAERLGYNVRRVPEAQSAVFIRPDIEHKLGTENIISLALQQALGGKYSGKWEMTKGEIYGRKILEELNIMRINAGYEAFEWSPLAEYMAMNRAWEIEEWYKISHTSTLYGTPAMMQKDLLPDVLEDASTGECIG